MADGFVGQAWVQIAPSFAGFQNQVASQVRTLLKNTQTPPLPVAVQITDARVNADLKNVVRKASDSADPVPIPVTIVTPEVGRIRDMANRIAENFKSSFAGAIGGRAGKALGDLVVDAFNASGIGQAITGKLRSVLTSAFNYLANQAGNLFTSQLGKAITGGLNAVGKTISSVFGAVITKVFGSDMGSKITSSLGNLFNAALKRLNVDPQGVTDRLGDKLAQGITGMIKKLVPGVNNVVKFFGDKMGSGLGGASEAASKVASESLDKGIGTALKNLVSNTKGATPAIGLLTTALRGLGLVAGAVLVARIGASIWNQLKQVPDRIRAALSGVGDVAAKALSSGAKLLGQAAVGAGKLVAAGVSTVGKGLAAAASGAASLISGGISAAGRGLAAAASGAARMISDAAGTMARNLASVFTAATGAVVGFAAANTQTYTKAMQMNNALELVAGQMGVNNKVIADGSRRMMELGSSQANARSVMMQFVRTGLDASKAWELYARAEDIAVTTGQTGNEVIQELIYGLQTGNTNLGIFRQINFNATDAVEAFAASIGKSKDELTETQKAQALLNGVMEATGNIAGVAGKMMAEGPFNWAAMQAPISNLREAVGGLLEPAFSAVGRSVFAFTKELGASLVEGGRFWPVVQKIREAVEKLGKPIAAVIDRVTEWMKSLKPTGDAVEGITGSIGDLLPVLAPLAGLLFKVGGANIAGALGPVGPIVEKITGAFGPIPAMLASVVATSPELRAMMTGLVKDMAPLAKQFLDIANDLMKQLMPALTEVMKLLMDSVGDLLPMLVGLLDSLKPVISIIGGALVQAFQAVAMLIPVFGQLLDALKPVLPILADIAAELLSAFVETIRAVLPSLESLIKAIGPIGEMIGEVLLGAVEALAPIIPTIAKAFVDLLAAVAPLLPIVVEIAGTIYVLFGQALEAIIPLVENLVGALAPVAEIIGEALLEALNALAPIIPTIAQAFNSLLGALLPLLPLLAEIAGQFIVALAEAFVAILPSIQQLIEQLRPVVQIIGVALLDAIEAISPILPILVQAFKDLVGALAPVLPIIAEVAGQLLGVLAEAFAALMPTVRDLVAAFKPMIPIIGEALLSAVSALAPVIPKLAQAFAQIVRALTPIIPLVVELAASLLEVGAELFADLMQLIADVLVDLAPVLRELMKALAPVVKTIGAVLVEAVRQLMPFMKPLLDVFMRLVKAVVPLIPPLGKLITTVINLAMKAITPLIGPAIKIVDVLVELAGEVLKPLIPLIDVLLKALSPFLDIFVTLAGVILELAGTALQALAKYLQPVMKYLTLLMDVLSPIIGIVAELVGGLLKLIMPVLKPFLDITIQLIDIALKPLMFVLDLLVKAMQPVIGILTKVIEWVAKFFSWIVGGSPGLIPGLNELKAVVELVWNAIKAAISFVWNNILKPIFETMINVFKAVGNAFMWVWENVIKKAWEALKFLFELYWNYYVKTIFAAFQLAWKLLSEAFKWAWEHLIRPAWEQLKNAFQWVWDNVLKRIFDLIKRVWNEVGNAIKWVWETIIKRAWDELGNALKGVRNLFDSAISVIKRVWEDVGGVIKSVWEKTIKFAFDKIGEALRGVRNAFSSAVDVIGSAWEGLKKAVGTPVKFVVDRVINPLINGANFLLSKIDLKIDPIDSSKIPSFAGGGPVPGRASGRGDNMLAWVRSREWVLTEGQADYLGRNWLRSLPHYSTGGEVVDTPWGRGIPGGRSLGPGAWWNPIDWGKGLLKTLGTGWDELKKLGGEVVNAATGLLRYAAAKAFEAGTLPLKKALEKTQSIDPPMFFTGAISRLGIKIIDKTIEFIRGKADSEEWGSGMGIDALAAAVMAQFPGLSITSGFRPGEGSYHGQNLARDIAAPTNAQGFALMDRAADWVRETLTASLLEGIYDSNGRGHDLSVKNGKTVPPSFWGAATWAAHGDGNAHLHLASQENAYPSADVGGNAGNWIAQAIAATKVNPRVWLDALMLQAFNESHYNPKAINLWDSNAKAGTPSKGLMQVIDPTFARYKFDNWNDIWNPVHNAAAAIRYIMGAYGAGPNTLGRWKPGGGYDDGGWLQPGTWLTVNNTGRPEPVLTNTQWDRVSAVAEGRVRTAPMIGEAHFHEEIDLEIVLRQLAWREQTEALYANN